MNRKEKLSIKRGDLVKVIAGGQKGLIGKIMVINYKKSSAILDTGKTRVKFIKNNQEKAENQDKEENKIVIPLSIHTSNLMAWDENRKEISRIGFKVLNNKKERYFIKSGNLISVKENNQNE